MTPATDDDTYSPLEEGEGTVKLVHGLIVLGLAASGAQAQGPDTQSRMAEQRTAMSKLDALHGTWRGEAWTMTPQGRHVLTQTERVGPMLGGTIKVIEGRGYEADGSVSFNAFATVSFEPRDGTYRMHSNAMGYSGSYTLRPTTDGFVWEIPAGPDATIRYTATLTPTSWVEVGDRVTGGGASQRIFEMKLARIGDTDWPSAGAVTPK